MISGAYTPHLRDKCSSKDMYTRSRVDPNQELNQLLLPITYVLATWVAGKELIIAVLGGYYRQQTAIVTLLSLSPNYRYRSGPAIRYYRYRYRHYRIALSIGRYRPLVVPQPY